MSEESQAPLIGATIMDSINGVGSISKDNGEFQIKIIKFPSVVIFRHLGYLDDTLIIRNKNHFKKYIQDKTVIVELRENPFLIDEVVVSNSRLAIKLFEKEPFDIIDFVVDGDRFVGYVYRNRNPLLREVFIGDFNGRIMDSKPLKGINEVYQDCMGEIYFVTNDSAYTINYDSDKIKTSAISDSDFFYNKIEPVKALGANHFFYLQKSTNGQYHDYFIVNSQNKNQELLYRVGEWRNEVIVENTNRQHKGLELSKIKKSYIEGAGMRQINSRLQRYLYSVFIEYPPVNSGMIQTGDSLLLFDYGFREIHCFKTNGDLLWASKLNVDLRKDFTGNIHYDEVSGRFFLEFLNIQLTYLIEINPLKGVTIRTIPILKYKHIDHLRIRNNQIFFLHQPDFGDRGKKIYYLDI